MKRPGAISSLLLLSCFAFGKDRGQNVPMPSEFEIGRHTFFDFGPPFHYYEVILVRPGESGTRVERVTLTPEADACTRPAQIESASGSLKQSVAELLNGVNPCAIPEKQLRHERKRCKHCSIFSGANVSMRVKCGSTTRILRSDVLDRDMFDSAARTPIHTSWTMSVLERLDQAVGPGVMQKPAFPVESDDQSSGLVDPRILRQIAAGEYDRLFEDAPDKPSILYVATQKRPVLPTVELLSSSPARPDVLTLPAYPPIAKTAHVGGTVVFTTMLDSNAMPTAISFRAGPQLLYATVKDTVSSWRFPKAASGQEIEGRIEFKLHCAASSPVNP
jgi:hypothetical protein